MACFPQQQTFRFRPRADVPLAPGPKARRRDVEVQAALVRELVGGRARPRGFRRSVGQHRNPIMVILELGRWLIDTAGKLGPLSIAAAVFVANQRQTKWNSGVVVRNSNLDDQKMRLALMDRRLAVMQHLRSARNEVNPAMKGAEALAAVLDALREAELIFDDEEQEAIAQCLHAVSSYQTQYGGSFNYLEGSEMVEALVAYNQCTAHVNALMKRLRDASRISSVAPLVPLK
jgi:hypothetical protein